MSKGHSLLRAWLWEQPQTLLGLANLALSALLGNVRGVRSGGDRVLVELVGEGAVSLGVFVFHASRDSRVVPVGPENLRHELGHAVQSRAFGPLYLPVVGVPSVLRVLYATLHLARTGRRWAHYYDGWPEDAADRLGGVDRTQRPAP